MYAGVRHNSPAGSDVCMLCPGGEPETNKYVAEITFIVRAGVPETEEYMTMVSELRQMPRAVLIIASVFCICTRTLDLTITIPCNQNWSERREEVI